MKCIFFEGATYLEFIIKSQKLSTIALAWENHQEVFVMLVVISFLYLHFVVVLHLSMFFIHIFFSASSLTLPWTIAGVVTPHFILSALPIAEWFTTLSFSTILLSSYRERYGFEWAFSTHRCFLPYTPFQHFRHNLLLSRLAWEPAVIFWNLQGLILILKTQALPIYLFDSP